MPYNPSINDASQVYPIDSWEETPFYAPTPGNFSRTPTPSIFSHSPNNINSHNGPLQRPRPDELGLLQLADWEEGGSYDEQPPTCIHYMIEWKVTLNSRVVAKDTEQDLVLTRSAYWASFLKQKAENILYRKISRNRQIKLDDTNLVVSVNDRSQRDLTKRFDHTDIDWSAIEKQLLLWGNLFRQGKRLRLNISINYIEDRNPRKADKRGNTSVTCTVLAEREAQIDAEQHASGQPSVWRDVYRIMRCPGSPCDNHDGYCWQDPMGKKHYKLKTLHLKSLVKYVERGGILETHDDIPDMVREQLYAEKQQRLERKQRAPGHLAAGSMCHPININVLPTQPSPPVLDGPAGTQATLPTSVPHPDSISIPGLLDEAVEEYSSWQQSRVSSESFKDDIKKAQGIALANCLDLKQIYEDRDPEFFIRQGVTIGVARRFVDDIGEWVKQCE